MNVATNGSRYKKQEDKMENKHSVKMFSKYPGTCKVCKQRIKVGQEIWYNYQRRVASHAGCFAQKTGMPIAGYSRKQRPFAGSYKNGRAKGY